MAAGRAPEDLMPTFLRQLLLIATGVATAPAVFAQAGDGAPPGSALAPAALVLSGVALAVAGTAVAFALHARRLAAHATEEAGQARARANQAGGGVVTPEALAKAERVWSARLTALEAQLATGPSRGATVRNAEQRQDNLASRLDEIERTVNGLSITMKDLRRPAPAAAPVREDSDIVWPVCLAAGTAAMLDVRQALAQALKGNEPAARDLLARLRAAELWAGRPPSPAEAASALSEISALLLAALRRGAAVAPLDGSLLSDRVLAALRPAWKSVLPQVDCRSFYPGATFDPDWMDDHTRAGLHRPVISEMLSWAVFEKLDSGRRVLAKARVTAD